MASIAASALIRPCKCDHAFQDKTYGPKMRVFTPGNKGVKCTVCNIMDSSVTASPAGKSGGKGK